MQPSITHRLRVCAKRSWFYRNVTIVHTPWLCNHQTDQTYLNMLCKALCCFGFVWLRLRKDQYICSLLYLTQRCADDYYLFMQSWPVSGENCHIKCRSRLRAVASKMLRSPLACVRWALSSNMSHSSTHTGRAAAQTSNRCLPCSLKLL